jgi:peptidoglycan hydrolase-like protein with peptidoglycan-binding domain
LERIKIIFMEKNRKDLWLSYKYHTTQKGIPQYKGIKDIDDFFKLFENENDTKGLRIWFRDFAKNPILGPDGVDLRENEFLTKYTCDLDWAKTKDFCKSSGTGGTGTGGAGTGGTGTGGTGTTSRWKDVNFTIEDIKKGKNIAEKWMKGDVVTKIQEELIKHGFTNISRSGNTDKLFGRRTKQAVLDFQKAMGIPETGTVDALTMLNLEQAKGESSIKSLPTGGDGSVKTTTIPKAPFDPSIFSSSSSITTIKEENGQTIDIIKAYQNGCFQEMGEPDKERGGFPGTFLDPTNPSNPKNQKKYLLFKNKEGNWVLFFEDYSKVVYGSDGTPKESKWSCDKLTTAFKSTACSSDKVTPDQKEYVSFMTGNSAYSCTQPNPRDIYPTNPEGNWEQTDLNTENPKLFPTKGIYFIYKRRGIDQTLQSLETIHAYVKKTLESNGYTFNEPAPGDNLGEVPLHTAMQTIPDLKNYIKNFPKNSMIFKTKISTSSNKQSQSGDALYNKIKSFFDKNETDQATCEESINFLLSSTQKNYQNLKNKGPVTQFFPNQEKAYTVAKYAFGCKTGTKQKKGVLGIGRKEVTALSKKAEENWNTLNTLRFDFNKGYYGFSGIRGEGDVVNEQKNTKMKNIDLNNIVRKKLTETLEKKQKTLTESKIINKRFGLLFEGKTFRTKQEKDELLIGIVSEILYLNSQNYDQKLISEGIDSLFSTLKSMFTDKGFEGIGQTLKERFAVWIAGKLGIESNSYFENLVISVIGNTPVEELPKLLTNCDFLVGKITKALPEAMIRKAQYNKGLGGAIGDVVRNSLYDMIEDNEFSNKVSNGLSTIVCPLISKLKDNLGGVFSGMRQRALTP